MARTQAQQSDHMIRNREVAINDIARINAEIIERRDYDLVYRNVMSLLINRFEIAQLRWRRGESPVSDFKQALTTFNDLMVRIPDWQVDSAILHGSGDVWNLISYAGFLLDDNVALPAAYIQHVRAARVEDADVALDYLILDALSDKDWRDGWQENVLRLAAKKRQALAVETYETYRKLLEVDGDVSNAERLVRKAEANYLRRATDDFFSGGGTSSGGGPDTPYVVDYVLAATLKKIGWTGETIHRWKWNAE